jgi:hypothetical protein
MASMDGSLTSVEQMVERNLVGETETLAQNSPQCRSVRHIST